MSLTSQQLLTAEDLWNMPNHGGRNELVRGELRMMAPAGVEHGAVVMSLAAPLAQYVKANQLGTVFAAETGFVIAREPDTVRAPDIAFVIAARMPRAELPVTFGSITPDLAVEVISPWDKVYEIEEKVEDWLAGGARLVWVVSPRTRSVTVHRLGAPVTVLNADQDLSGLDVVPGFSIKIADIFR